MTNKKNKLAALVLALFPLSLPTLNANVNSVDIPLQVSYVDPANTQDGPKRTPTFPLNVSLDGHTLLLNIGYDLTLVLLDEDGDVAYTVYVPAGTSAVMLPATLCGDYEIQLYPDDSSYYFFGWVEL